jgi:DNA-directed RNA polymerase subunit RPC12/RpoP
MPRRKQDKRLRERHFGMTTLFTLPFLICFALAWSRPLFWVGVIGCAAILLAGLVFQELRLRRYHCPDCGALLPYTLAAPYARIEYFCSRCDVIWDSG